MVCAGGWQMWSFTLRAPATFTTQPVSMGDTAAGDLPASATAVVSCGVCLWPCERQDRSDLQSDRSSAGRGWGGAGRTGKLPPLLAPLRPWLSLLLTRSARLSCPRENCRTAIIRAQSRTEKRKLPTEKIQYISVMVT